MECQVKRRWETPRSITGELWIDGNFICFTLEPSRNTPVHSGHPCIAVGRFRVILTPSPHLGYVTPELVFVPGRSDIRMHVGNYPKDVLGCTVVGSMHSEDFVGDSHKTFEESVMPLFINARDRAEEIWVEYFDPPKVV